jgi:hypothetical protein
MKSDPGSRIESDFRAFEEYLLSRRKRGLASFAYLLCKKAKWKENV